jgi:peptidyl-prolyl cis-trans isomerase SurA
MRILVSVFFLSFVFSNVSLAQSDSSHVPINASHIQSIKKDTVYYVQKDSCLLRAEKIRKRLLKGGNFCELVREFSDDYGSLVVCGELGYFKTGVLVPEYEAAALKLKPGEISSIVKSHYGYHIIQLINIKYDENNHISFDTRHILIKSPC